LSGKLERVEQIIDASPTAGRIEALLPAGVRPRQLKVRTLLIGMVLAMLAGRDALLTNVLAALLELPEADRRRLGVIARWNDGEHQLSYRQLEYTYRLTSNRLANDQPDGTPSEVLAEVLDALLEASVTVLGEPDSSSYAVDWSDHETWSRPPAKKPANPSDPVPATGDTKATAENNECACEHAAEHATADDRPDPEAARGHRNTNHPGRSEMFFGYYLQAVTAVRDEHGPDVPELTRRMHLASCRHDPPPALVPVIARMHHDGIQLGDLLASGRRRAHPGAPHTTRRAGPHRAVRLASRKRR
jgi:hypothetical protein